MDIGVIGMGLIGGSVIRTLAAAGHQVLGYDADPATRATARTAAARARPGARWQVVGSVQDVFRGASGAGPSRRPHDGAGPGVNGGGLVVLAVPLPAVEGALAELSGCGYQGLVTDVTSVKEPVRQLAARYGLTSFVGGHPMAGREISGFAAATEDLFDGCAWVLCLEPGETDLAQWLELAALLTGLGARVVPSTAVDHDRAAALISHLPHLVAAALATRAGTSPLALTLAAGSFRDGTRVAASNPRLVAAMCGGNAPALGPALAALLEDLTRAAVALDSGDSIPALTDWLTPGAVVRTGWPAVAGEPTQLPANADVLLRLGQVGGWVAAVAPDRRSVSAARPSR